MSASDAMDTLARAGRGAEAREIVESASAATQARYAAIQSDETRTEDFKRDEMARVYEEDYGRLSEKLEGLAKSAAMGERADRERVFGTSGLPGDAASLMISRRDAVDRVDSVRGGTPLRELLARANRTGDEVLARAVAEKALAGGDGETLNAFLADRPHLDATMQRLWDASRRDVRDGMVPAMFLMGMKPPRSGR